MLGIIFREFLENTSIHGIRFCIDRKIHWSERLFWFICLLISWYGSILLMYASWDAFKNNPISFVVETTYKEWNTEFPSLTICEVENNDRIEEASDNKLWTSEHDFNLEEVLKEIAFYKGVSYYLYQFCATQDADPNCPKGNFTYYANMVRSKCDEMLSNCTWVDDFFDCCEYFLPLDTELGPCYAINSIQRRNPNGKSLTMNNNKLTGPGIISFNVHVPANVYIIGEEEVPALTSLTSDILAVAGNIHYK
ncbi:sodium channel protein Nach-like [Arctopsyche grandis]|uniref:sodium channel protein Nach-like n=1 Tax=Arctopsyche grandis TaxID=121162 RepID=UPI00406D920C